MRQSSERSDQSRRRREEREELGLWERTATELETAPPPLRLDACPGTLAVTNESAGGAAQPTGDPVVAGHVV